MSPLVVKGLREILFLRELKSIKCQNVNIGGGRISLK